MDDLAGHFAEGWYVCVSRDDHPRDRAIAGFGLRKLMTRSRLVTLSAVSLIEGLLCRVYEQS